MEDVGTSKHKKYANKVEGLMCRPKIKQRKRKIQRAVLV